MSDPSTYQDGSCSACDKPVRRELPDGRFGQMLAGLPMTCEACQDLKDRQEHDQQAERQVFQTRRAAHQRLSRAGIPSELQRHTLEDLDDTERRLAAAWASIKHPMAGLLLSGQPGVGKSTTAAAAARAAVQAGWALAWLHVPTLSTRLSRPFADKLRLQTLDALEAATGCLVIDDIDKSRPTEYGAEPIFAAVDACVSNGRQLLVTTNLDPRELGQHWPDPWGDAIASRLLGYCVEHLIGGPDRRLQPRATRVASAGPRPAPAPRALTPAPPPTASASTARRDTA